MKKKNIDHFVIFLEEEFTRCFHGREELVTNHFQEVELKKGMHIETHIFPIEITNIIDSEEDVEVSIQYIGGTNYEHHEKRAIISLGQELKLQQADYDYHDDCYSSSFCSLFVCSREKAKEIIKAKREKEEMVIRKIKQL